MIDNGIVGGGWIEIKPGNYSITKIPKSTCQLEIDVAFDCDIGHAAEGEWSRMAPIRILSFDIECSGRKGTFPEPEKDPVIQIANLVTRLGKVSRNFFLSSKVRRNLSLETFLT